MSGVHVVVSFVGGRGHLEPLLPLAEWARRIGHRVTVVGQASVVERARRLGYDVEAVGPDTLATTAQPLLPVDRDGERVVMRDHFVARYGRSRTAALGALYDRDRPALVICDEVDVGSVAAAELRRIPCVSVAVLAAGLLMATEVVGPAWDALRKELSLDTDPEGQRLAGSLAIAPFPRSLRSPRAPTATPMRFVRPPILDDVAPATDARQRPLVYATLGTVFNMESGDLLTRMVHAMNALTDTTDIDVVITTGPGIAAPDLPPARPRVRVVEFMPQHEVLGRCRAVVSHAGSGTLAAVLALGIPVVNLPMGADQPDNADRCEELGVGIALDAVHASPAEICESTRTVLETAAFPDAAAALAREAAAQPRLHDVSELGELLDAPA